MSTRRADAQLEAFQAGVPLAQVLAMAPIDVTPEAERQSVEVITRTTGA